MAENTLSQANDEIELWILFDNTKFLTPKDNSIRLSVSQDLKALLDQKKSLSYEYLRLQNQISEKDQVLKIRVDRYL